MNPDQRPGAASRSGTVGLISGVKCGKCSCSLDSSTREQRMMIFFLIIFVSFTNFIMGQVLVFELKLKIPRESKFFLSKYADKTNVVFN